MILLLQLQNVLPGSILSRSTNYSHIGISVHMSPTSLSSLQLISVIYVDNFDSCLTLYSIDTHITTSATDAFKNIVGKGEIARNEQFLLFPQCFLIKQIIVSQFVHIFAIISLFAAELEEP